MKPRDDRWLNHLAPNDQEQATANPQYKAALARTFAGEVAQLKAEAAGAGHIIRHIAELEATRLRLITERLTAWFRSGE